MKVINQKNFLKGKTRDFNLPVLKEVIVLFSSMARIYYCFFILFGYIYLVSSKKTCLPGSSECKNNSMNICDLTGHWVTIDCPRNSVCEVKENSLACVVQKKETNKSQESDSFLSDDGDEVDTQSSQEAKEDVEEKQSEDLSAEQEPHRKSPTKKNISQKKDKIKDNKQILSKKRAPNKKDMVKENQKIDELKELNKSLKKLVAEKSKGEDIKSIYKESKKVKNSQPEETTVTKTVEKRVGPKQITFEYNKDPESNPNSKYITYSSSDTGVPPTVLLSVNAEKNITLSPQPSDKQDKPLSGSKMSSSSTPASANVSSAPSSAPKSTISSKSSQPSRPSSAQSSKSSGTPSYSSSSTPIRPPKPPSAANQVSDKSSLITSQKDSGAPPASGGPAALPPASKPAADKPAPPAGAAPDSKPAASTPSAGGGGANITKEQVSKAVTACGFPAPDDSYLAAIVDKTNAGIKNNDEAAMFIAQLIHESGGFQFMVEQACQANPDSCKSQYDDGTGVPGKLYYGRGFIQLSWPANYKKASEGLGKGDQLLQDPDSVGKDPNLAMDVSVWFWNANVTNAPGVSNNQFGSTTKAINGTLECNGSNVEQSKKRYSFYLKTADAFGITNKAAESGCY